MRFSGRMKAVELGQVVSIEFGTDRGACEGIHDDALIRKLRVHIQATDAPIPNQNGEKGAPYKQGKSGEQTS